MQRTPFEFLFLMIKVAKINHHLFFNRILDILSFIVGFHHLVTWN